MTLLDLLCKVDSSSGHACRWLEGRGQARSDHPQKLPVSVMLMFGACSGLVAQTATYPFDVVRRQMQVQNIRALC